MTNPHHRQRKLDVKEKLEVISARNMTDMSARDPEIWRILALLVSETDSLIISTSPIPVPMNPSSWTMRLRIMSLGRRLDVGAIAVKAPIGITVRNRRSVNPTLSQSPNLC